MPPLPTMMPARSTVTGTPAAAEQALHLAAAAQVRGELVGLAAEPAEVDDLPHARLGGGPPERAGRLGVEPLEVLGVQRVHQVVGGRAAGEGAAAGVSGVVHVAAHRRAHPS